MSVIIFVKSLCLNSIFTLLKYKNIIKVVQKFLLLKALKFSYFLSPRQEIFLALISFPVFYITYHQGINYVYCFPVNCLPVPNFAKD